MRAGLEPLIGMAALVVVALAVFAVYRWRQRQRVRRVDGWVRDYLAGRYGKLPNGLNVNCSDDTLWPVLVAFGDPLTGARRRLRFDCAGPRSTFSLLSETEDAVAPAR